MELTARHNLRKGLLSKLGIHWSPLKNQLLDLVQLKQLTDLFVPMIFREKNNDRKK